MQTVASVSEWSRGFLLAALYVSLFGCATAPAPAPVALPPAAVAPSPAAPPPAPLPPAVVTGAVAEPATVVVAVPGSGAAQSEPHIALILPLNSPTFAKAADAVQQGFLAAAAQHEIALPVRVYAANDEKIEIKALYQQALKEGAVAVAGPLTRNGVAALAENTELSAPTLALNVTESKRADRLYFFGLPVEQEARQIAQMAAKAGLLHATIVRSNTALSKRLALAFGENWKKAGGTLRDEIVYAGDIAPLRALTAKSGNMVFLAAETEQARLIRPYIAAQLPIYATSQVFAGNANNMVNYDLAEVRFVDMPWLVQPDHEQVQIYPRSAPPLPQDMERLYAFGIDAFRLLYALYRSELAVVVPLDGVTGTLYLNDHLLEREAAPAVLRQGQGYATGSKLLPLQYQPPAEGKPQ